MHAAARARASAQPTYAAVRRAPQPNGDLIVTTVERGTGIEETRRHLWADLFEEADAEYEAGVLADHRAVVAAAEAEERDRVAAAEAEEREREEQAERDRMAAAEQARSDRAYAERLRRRAEDAERAREDAVEDARRAAERAEERRLDQEWLQSRWYRPLGRALGRVLGRADLSVLFSIVMCAALAVLVLFALHWLRPQWEDWRTAAAPDPPAAIATPTQREEDYLAAHQHALEMVAEWETAIESRIERNRSLPNGIDLAGARAQLAYWAERADALASALQRYQE